MKDNRCRLCLQPDANLVALFTIKASNVRETLMKLIKETIGIEMTLDDVVKTVCWNCLADVVNFGRFRALCILNNNTIHDIVGGSRRPTGETNDFLLNREIKLVFNWLKQKRVVLEKKNVKLSLSGLQGNLTDKRAFDSSCTSELSIGAFESPSIRTQTRELYTQTSSAPVRTRSIQTGRFESSIETQTDRVQTANKELQCNICCSLDDNRRTSRGTDQLDGTSSRTDKHNRNNNNHRTKQRENATLNGCQMTGCPTELQKIDSKCHKRKSHHQSLATLPSSTNYHRIPQPGQVQETTSPVESTLISRKPSSRRKISFSVKANSTRQCVKTKEATSESGTSLPDEQYSGTCRMTGPSTDIDDSKCRPNERHLNRKSDSDQSFATSTSDSIIPPVAQLEEQTSSSVESTSIPRKPSSRKKTLNRKANPTRQCIETKETISKSSTKRISSSEEATGATSGAGQSTGPSTELQECDDSKRCLKRKNDDLVNTSTNNSGIPRVAQLDEQTTSSSAESIELPSRKIFKATKTVLFNENAKATNDANSECTETDDTIVGSVDGLFETDLDCPNHHGALDKSPSLFHFLHVQENKKDYLKICTYCDKALYSAKEAAIHKRSHMQCNMCRKKFRSFRQTLLHLTQCEFTQTVYVSLMKVDSHGENSDIVTDAP